MAGAVVYEIFLRSFQDSNGDGNRDLKGITSRLEYLQSLGVTGIWLTPIFESPSYHGYDAINFKSMNTDFGTLDDFKELLVKAHALGIKVILDIAINHTSNKYEWFLDASSGPKSLNRHKYVWRDTVPG